MPWGTHAKNVRHVSKAFAVGSGPGRVGPGGGRGVVCWKRREEARTLFIVARAQALVCHGLGGLSVFPRELGRFTYVFPDAREAAPAPRPS